MREGSKFLTLEETGFQGKIRALGSRWEVRQEEKQEAEGLAAGPSKGTSGRRAQMAVHEGCLRASEEHPWSGPQEEIIISEVRCSLDS